MCHAFHSPAFKIKTTMKQTLAIMLGALALAGAQAHANLVQNPGFETGDFTDWTVSGNIGVFPGGANSGTYSASFTGAISGGYLNQNIATTTGDVYDISFWLESDGQISFSASFGSDTFYSINNVDIGSPYTEVTVNNVSAAGASTLLHLTFQESGADSFGALDDISVTDVTPVGVPDSASTAGLLGLALAGLLALRRRLAAPVSVY